MERKKTRVYAFVGPSGTGKSYRAQMVASANDIHHIIDDGILINENEVLAGTSTNQNRNSKACIVYRKKRTR